MNFTMEDLLKLVIKEKASDLHLTVNSAPALRINGKITRLSTPPLTAQKIKELCYSLLNDEQKKSFESTKELDFSFAVKDMVRVRGNLFVQKGSVAAVFRRINEFIPAAETLGFNKQVLNVLKKPHGLVLVTGATGSGKSTTLASFIDNINENRRQHIITIEEPIEFSFKHKKCIVNQREVGSDCESFLVALRQVLREDPDVIVVGELRDEQTAEMALKAAETGHLVFATLHTNGSISSINRLIQMFPKEKQQYVRTILSFTLEAVISQALCETTDKKNRILAYEFLSVTPAIRHLIRDDKLHQVQSQMQMGQEKHGMMLLNQTLFEHYKAGRITEETALTHSPDVEELERIVRSYKMRKAS